ncbi:MAG: hypothetical protein KUG70_14760 [Rhodobacteraceae bacterium]|nr:hypothetical protein [Paracoccaceae bacterium]
MSERPERELPMLAQTMRERGLHVDRVTTDADGVPSSITVWWNGDVDGHHRRAAEHLAQPIEKIRHENPRAHAASGTRRTPTTRPFITNPDGTTRTYIVAKGWVDAA